jgi:hypothetical protein
MAKKDVAEAGKRGDYVEKDMMVLGLRVEDAQERLRWRKAIRGTV